MEGSNKGMHPCSQQTELAWGNLCVLMCVLESDLNGVKRADDALNCCCCVRECTSPAAAQQGFHLPAPTEVVLARSVLSVQHVVGFQVGVHHRSIAMLVQIITLGDTWKLPRDPA